MSRFINTRTRLPKNQSIAIKPVIICVLFSRSNPAIINEKVRGLHVVTDFRPPKKNMRMRTGQPQTFLHRIFSCHLARNPC